MIYICSMLNCSCVLQFMVRLNRYLNRRYLGGERNGEAMTGAEAISFFIALFYD